jgi:spore coat-associated protein N
MASKRISAVARSAVVAAALALAFLSTGERQAPAAPGLWAAAGATFSTSNSKDGEAILSLANMRPGASATGTVTIANTGTIAGDFALAPSDMSDVPGPGGGALSGVLDLLVEDLTGGAPLTVYAGKLAAMGARPLGTFAGGEAHSYRFTVSFPSTGPADNTLMASRLSVSYRWTATGEERGTGSSAGSGGVTGGGPAPPPDKRAPKLRLGGKKRQHVLPRARRRAGLVVVVGSDEAATVRVKVELDSKGRRTAKRARRAASIGFKRATTRLLAGKRTRLPLKLSPKSARLARRLLRGQKGIKATVIATATDASENATTKRLRVRLLK